MPTGYVVYHRGLSRVNTMLPIIGIYAADREPFSQLFFYRQHFLLPAFLSAYIDHTAVGGIPRLCNITHTVQITQYLGDVGRVTSSISLISLTRTVSFCLVKLATWSTTRIQRGVRPAGNLGSMCSRCAASAHISISLRTLSVSTKVVGHVVALLSEIIV